MFPFNFEPYHKLKRRYKKVDGVTVIEMNLKNADYLFDGRDPAPFREKDLDEDAAKYIITSLREIDEDEIVRLKIHITQPRGPQDHVESIQDAIRTFFSYEAEMKRSEREHIFRMAFKSLIIGMTVLSICLYLSQYLEGRQSFLTKFLSEGLHILGWYSMWKPVYFGLYEWWPIREDELLLLKAANMDIEIQYANEHRKLTTEETVTSSLATYNPIYK